jgi:hypothetical protein
MDVGIPGDFPQYRPEDTNMRNKNMKRFLLGLSSLVAACGDATSPIPEGGAVVTFAFSATRDTLDVLVLDSTTIAQAERRVATGEGPRMPVGPIVRGAGLDRRYPFHYVPGEVRLADLAAEVCDGRPMRNPVDVDDFFELSTGNRAAHSAIWCPWGATPISVRRRES